MIRPVIDTLFPPHVQVMAEPGRYFVANAFVLAVNIIARRVIMRDKLSDSYEVQAGRQRVASMDDHPSFMCKFILSRLHQRRHVRQLQLHHV